jgi:hypothetical protein
MKEQSMTIKFEGNSHQVDANTLINVLIHYQNVINTANQIYGNGEREVKMRVNAIEKGSFVIDFSIVETLKGLFSGASVEYMANLFGVIGGVFALYKMLKGKKATNGDITINGDVTIDKSIRKIYNTHEVREAISKSVETAKEDDNVDGISITLGEYITTFSREEFTEYIYNDFDEENLPEERVQEQDAILYITSLSFESKNKWRFIYNGFPISITVKDDALMDAIDKGERFGKGDALHVKLKIVQKYDDNFNTYVNSSYKILEFYQHIDAPKQSRLNFE